jgi:hypothetical protein
MKSQLSRVYFDGQPVTLMGDEAAPPLSRIIRAGGKAPKDVDVLYLTSPADSVGHIVGAEEIIDRSAEPTRPIYLRSVPKGSRKPIHTALGDDDWPSPVVPALPASQVAALPPKQVAAVAMPNVDPVIAQLGTDPPWREGHDEGVFKAPSDPRVVSPDAAAPPAPKRAERNAEALAAAEAEAEERQESVRNQEDLLNDEQEASEDADEDSDSKDDADSDEASDDTSGD